MRNIIIALIVALCSMSVSMAKQRSGDSRYTGYTSGKKGKSAESKKTHKERTPKSKKTKFKTKKGKEPKSKRTHYSEHKRSEPSVFAGFNEELKGFKMHIDAVGSYEFADSTGMNSPVAGLTIAPGYQITRRFFVGLKGGTMYAFNDLLSFPASVNLHWTWGKKSHIIFDTSIGAAYCKEKVGFYNDLSMGYRIPIKAGHSISITLGYCVYPQYVLLDDDEGGTYRDVMSWISPQLRVSYGVNIGRKR